MLTQSTVQSLYLLKKQSSQLQRATLDSNKTKNLIIILHILVLLPHLAVLKMFVRFLVIYAYMVTNTNKNLRDQVWLLWQANAEWNPHHLC